MRHLFTTLLFLCFCCIKADAQEQWNIGNVPRQVSAVKDSPTLFRLLARARKMEEQNSDSAASYYYKILKSCVANDYRKGIDSTLIYMHRCYWKRGASKNTFNILHEFMTENKAVRIDPFIYAQLCNDLGIYHLYKGRYEEAATYFNSAKDKLTDTSHQSQSLLFAVYSNLGTLWGTMHEDATALIWFKKAEALAIRLNKHQEMAAITVNLGAIYVNKESWDTAYAYSLKARELAKQYNIPGTFSTANLNLAHISLQRNDPQLALRFIHEGLDSIGRETASRLKEGMMDSALTPNHLVYYHYEGWAYYQLKDYAKAREKLQFALQKQKKYGFRTDAMPTMLMLSRVYADMGNYKDAYEQRLGYLEIKDSLDRLDKANALDVEIKYRTAEKDKAVAQKQLQLSQAENALQRKNIMIVAISAGAILLIIVILAIYRSNRHKQKLQTERIRTLQQEQEISNLKSMMRGEEKERVRLARELHDGIMVNLSTVKMKLKMFRKMQQAETPGQELNLIITQLEGATKELRQTAHNLMPDMLLEGGLGEAMLYFCKNQQHEGLVISFQEYGRMPRLQQEFELALYRMVQELVQNIIKHAHASKAMIQLNYQNDLLFITVEDNGIGFNARDLVGKDGIGLKSIQTRIRALNGIMDIKSSEENGTSINLEFDVRAVTIPKKQNYAY
jgi:two-component system NarL family sensor kinase